MSIQPIISLQHILRVFIISPGENLIIIRPYLAKIVYRFEWKAIMTRMRNSVSRENESGNPVVLTVTGGHL